MATHVITDPDDTTAPTPPPAATGWETLSAAFTEEAPSIADRDDLIVTIAPGAAHGHPAVFMTHSAAIEIDGDRLRIDPATARPERNSDRTRYAAVWGAFVHECAHAAHSRWTAPPIANPAVVQAALLLEESRIEGNHIRRRPDDRHWLRASAIEIVIGDTGGADAAAHIPATAFAAANNAALILGRVDAGILEPDEGAPVAAACETILGPDTLAELRAIWQQAHTVTDDDTTTMLELGQRWLDLIGPDPHADPEPASILSGAIGETVARIVAELAGHAIAPDPAEEAEGRARAEATRVRETETVARGVFGKDTSSSYTRPPTDEERTAARVLARALSAASGRERATVTTTSALPPGRLRMRGVLAREAQRAAGAMPTAEPFTRTTRKTIPVPPLRVGIACDISGSMSAYAEPVASAAWIIANAADLATLPAESATVTFGRHVRAITRPGVTPTKVTGFKSRDNWEALDRAVDALDGALGLSRRENTRLLVIISDGMFVGKGMRRAGQQRIDRLRAAGCAVLWLVTDLKYDTPLEGVTVHDVSDPATTVRAIARAATTAVRAA
ncbi:hypothetical protein ACFWU5_26790 [Nocardia sp. NPDC058640]|uniref:hypothetical protein n=1 Tax=Nocardia sp. NPDC058640 TaxID=3346571 RepID=UPI00365485C6